MIIDSESDEMESTDRSRLFVCGADAMSSTALATRLNEASGHDRRHVILVDTSDPTHVLRLADDARASDVAVVMVDARSAGSPETRRELHVLLALGLRRVAIAVDNMELVDYAEEVFTRAQRESDEVAATLRVPPVVCVPIAASNGENIALPTTRMPWYRGPVLRDCLDRTFAGGEGQASPRLKPGLADRFEASIVWTADRPMLQSRSYLMRLGEVSVSATVAPLKYRVETHTLQHAPAKTLAQGDLGVCNLELGEPVSFDEERRRFKLLDDVSKEVVGAGLLHFALHRSQNVQWQTLDINKEHRAALMAQKPCVVWFTGLSGAGKSTIANLVEKRLHALGRHTYLLDGDNVRHGLNKDLGFTDADRVENIRRVAEVARLMVDAGLVVLVSFISPFRSERRMARALVGEGEFVEVFVDTPLDVAESRDPKGLYGKARRGELKNFTGVDSPYDIPEGAEIRLDTTRLSAEESADAILDHLEQAGIVGTIPRVHLN